MTANGNDPALPDAPSTRVQLGDREVTIERVSARKASSAFAILRAVGSKVPELVNRYGEFQQEYAETHALELDRAQAELRYGPTPVVGPDGEPVRYPDTVDVDGRVERHPRAGEVVVAPSQLAAMTDEAWESVDNKLRLPRSPSTGETVAALFPEVLDVAEEHVYRLLALFTMANADVKAHRRDGTLKDELDRRVDELLDDALADELLELAVVCGEVVESQFVVKAQSLGGRLGNALRLVGLDPKTTSPSPTTSTPEPSTTKPATSTDSPATSDGERTTPSTPPTTSSPPSPLAATPSAPG